ncbi:hypothetical protein H8E77_41540 [bacterium]|nr:hypothetical protein [bacterium]
MARQRRTQNATLASDAAPSAAERDEIDPVFKEVLIFRFRQLDIPLQTEVEVSRMPRTIDALIVLEQEADLQTVRVQTPFDHFLRHNLIEFKGIRDALTVFDYHLILGRAHLYVGENEVWFDQVTITIICARKPRKLLSQIPFQAVRDGIYVRHSELPVYLIVINELPIVPKNYPLLLFASSKEKFQQFLQQTLEVENLDYISFAYHLRPQLTKEVLTMVGRHRIPKKDLEFMAKDIGPELLPFIEPEEVLKHLSLEDRLRGLNVEERRTLKQLLENLEKSEQPQR